MKKIDNLMHVSIGGIVLFGGIFLFRYLIDRKFSILELVLACIFLFTLIFIIIWKTKRN